MTQSFAGGAAVRVDAQLVPDIHEGRLRVSASPGDSIHVDQKLVGLGEWEGKLPSGVHAVEVTAEGKEPWRADSMVTDDQLTTVLVRCRIARSRRAWPGVPTWVWIAGGSVLAVGLGTGAYFPLQARRQRSSGAHARLTGDVGAAVRALR